jgi:hypothetical protein
MKLAVLLTGAILAAAQPRPPRTLLGTSGPWSVVKLPHACSLETTLDTGTRVGIAQTADIAASPQIFLSNSAWRSLKVGQRVPVDLSWKGSEGDVPIDRAGTGEAVAVPGDAGFVLQIGMPYGSLLEAFSNSATIEVRTNGTSLASIPTRPVFAIMKLYTCAKGTADPFAK